MSDLKLTGEYSKSILADLQGQIERITYTNEENGFTVARVKVYGCRDLVTVVGNLMSPMPGEILNMKGEWSSHPQYGTQFKVVYYTTKVPASVYGIKKYLGSGLIKGIGPCISERIVKKFGKETLDIIEQEVERLCEIEGIGKKRVAMIKTAWQEQKEIRQVMLFLQTNGVSSGYATKIYKQYGNDAIEIVKNNPYRLAMDIWGIGFITADNIAQKLGFEKESPKRAQAGILYVLNQLADEGHVYYPYEPLLDKSKEILDISKDIIRDALAFIAADKKVVVEDLNESLDEFKINNKAVFLTQFYVCETSIARRIKKLLRTSKNIRPIDKEKALEWVQSRLAISLATRQIESIESAIKHKVMIITGGPGTGKTTIINAILRIFDTLDVKIMLAAPTGRAAKRMSETTGYPAKTIHRMLEFSFNNGGFKYNDKNQLKCDLLIIDEASMIDTVLMHHLLKAVPEYATFILVGDVNQLPSVGPGNILNDIISSKAVPVVKLNEIFRQAKESQIIVNAHKINDGILPCLKIDLDETDFYFIEQEDPEKVVDIILKLTKERIPVRFGLDPMNDIQVLTPMHRGVAGASNLNKRLQDALNPGQDGIQRGERQYRLGDKVMQIKNNYDKDIFNGDIGRISNLDIEAQEIVVSFDGRDIIYEFADLDEIVLAYAVSVHKSQGSEYQAVVMPILTQHYILLQRNLIYTGVTRGKSLVVIVGTKKAMAIGVRNNKTQKRYTYLNQRLAM